MCCDGTFKTVPQFYYQLYTIHSRVSNHSFPMVYILTKRKTFEFYKTVLTVFDGITSSKKKSWGTEKRSMSSVIAFYSSTKCRLCFWSNIISFTRRRRLCGNESLDYIKQAYVPRCLLPKFDPKLENYDNFSLYGKTLQDIFEKYWPMFWQFIPWKLMTSAQKYKFLYFKETLEQIVNRSSKKKTASISH